MTASLILSLVHFSRCFANYLCNIQEGFVLVRPFCDGTAVSWYGKQLAKGARLPVGGEKIGAYEQQASALACWRTVSVAVRSLSGGSRVEKRLPFPVPLP